MADRITICIVHPERNAYTETFIRTHIDQLFPGPLVLYGGGYEGHLPDFHDGGSTVSPESGLLKQLVRKAQRRLFRLPWDHFHKTDIAGLLKQHHVEVVLAEFGPTGVAMLDSCVRAGVPLIVHFFGYDAYQDSILQGVGKGYSALFAVAAAIVVVSHDMKEQLARLGAPREKLHYIPCGADTTLFQMTDAGSNPPTFVAVGRFVDKKAPYLTLLAFQRVYNEVANARLVMVGDGPLWETCCRLSKALGIDAAVDLPGPCSHTEMVALLRTARAFVQHSVHAFSGDSEGTPVAVLEAGASGLPVIATRHAGIQDVVLHEQTGLLVDEGDVEGMAQAMRRLAFDAPLAGRLGQAARARVEQNFQLDDTLAKLRQVISSVNTR